MSDLIRREDAIEAFYDMPYVLQVVEELPSAEAVKVVRCRDCKHRYISGNGTTRYYVCDFMDAQYEDNGFCHHGERKGGDDE